ncbi:MAG: hypothetical protein WC522_07645 [Candidatus Omnitrophota bacterium]
MRKRVILIIVMLSVFPAGRLFAEPGIKITQPSAGASVNPGQEIAVTVEARDGFIMTEGFVGLAAAAEEGLDALPATRFIYVPKDSVGSVCLVAMARDAAGNLASDEINLTVTQTAVLQSLHVTPDWWEFQADYNGNIEEGSQVYIAAWGLYSDGVWRNVTNLPNTSYISGDPSIASVSGNKVEAKGVGETAITVSNSNITKSVPIRIIKRLSFARSETIPPVTRIAIQPQPSGAGWHNSDITATLDADDNQGGSGVQEIVYQFSGQPQEELIPGNHAVISINQDGSYILDYYSVDNDRNHEDPHSVELKLDKTPPVTTAIITPPPDENGYIKSLPVKVAFSATDNLSGVAFTTPEKTFTASGTYQVEYYSRDAAGNTENAKTVTLNIVPQDTTAPEISLELKPVTKRAGRRIVTVPNRYTLAYSATDGGSGVKEVKAGLAMPDMSLFKVKLARGKRLHIAINERKRTVVIKAPNPQKVLSQINEEGILAAGNGQPLFLKLLPAGKEWSVTYKTKQFIIRAPKIIIKAKAVDNAGNAAAKQLEYNNRM